MVKNWIIMIVLSIILAVSCYLESTFVKNSFSWLINSLEGLQIELTESKDDINKDEFIELANSIHESWHKKVKVLKCLIWHTGIKDTEVGLARISSYIKENDYTEANAEIMSLIDYMAHYADDFILSWENVF